MKRVDNFWGKDLPVLKGSFNFDFIKVDYLRNRNAALEGFRAGLYDIFVEPDINQWHQSYNFPAVRKGRVIKESIEYQYPASMNALAFNLRRKKWQNPKLREALVTVLDFEWINKKLLYGSYERFESIYTGSPLAATDSLSRAEYNLLKPYRGILPDTVFEKFKLPETDGSGSNRELRAKILKLFEEAGYQLVKGRLVDQHKEPLSLNLITDDDQQERLLLSYKKSLSDLGITLNISTLDGSMFIKRVRDRHFDLVEWRFWHSMYPGSEQFNMWHSSMADERRSSNVTGIQNPAIDAMLDYFVKANDFDELIPVGRSLDRIVMSGHYMIPLWHTKKTNVAYWSHLKHGPQNGLHWMNLSTWWIDKTATRKP